MKQNKYLTMFISLLAAICLWIYVITVVNPDGEITIDNIPVSFTGAEVLREDHDLLIAGDYTEFVSVRFSGKNSDLKRLEQNSDEIKAVVDVTNIRSTKTYSRGYTVTLPVSLQDADIQVADRTPSSISFSMENQITRQIPVRCDFSGVEIAEGYMMDSTGFDYDYVTVEGRQSVVETIECASISMSRTNVDRSIKEEVPFTLQNSAGESIDPAGLEMSVDAIEVSVGVVMYKDVPLEVTIIDGGGATGSDVTREIVPKYVTISGGADVLDGLNKIDLGTVDLSKMIANVETMPFPIMIPNEAKNVSGEEEALVTIEIKNKEIAVVRVSNITFKNVAEGMEPNVITQQLPVTIRASAADIGKISSNNVRAVADMAEFTQAGGYQVPVSIYIDGYADAGYVGEYSIAVTLSKAEDE